MRTLSYAEAADEALAQAMAADRRVIVLGEDVHMIRRNLFVRSTSMLTLGRLAPAEANAAVKRYLKDPEDDPCMDVRGRRFRHRPIEENERYYASTTGDFFAAWIDHGNAPDGAACSYTMLVGATDEETTGFAEEMADPERAPCAVLRQDESAHILRDRASDTTACVVFDARTALEEGVPGAAILSVSRPCFLMARSDGGALRLSVASTDVRAEAPLAVDLAGAWALDAPPAGVAVTPRDGGTRLDIAFDDYMPVRLRLRKAP